MNDLTTTMPDTAVIAGMVEIERLRRENGRLRELVQEAYFEGWNSSHNLERVDKNWLRSNSRAALQEAGDERTEIV